MLNYPVTTKEPQDERLRTASEIEREAEDKMRIARAYEAAINEERSAQKALEHFRRVVSAPDQDLEALQAIFSAATNMSTSHQTRGGMLRPGGYELRGFILEEVGAALTRVKAARTAIENRLPEIEARAAEARSNLERFEKKHAPKSEA